MQDSGIQRLKPACDGDHKPARFRDNYAEGIPDGCTPLGFADALNDAPASNLFFDNMATGGHHDASSCSTATSDQQSDKRKRPIFNEEASFKPYECRFCPMKFGKSQALGGHMNRHRQEREREQVVQARQLLMQQEFSSAVLMSGQNPSIAKLRQVHLPRSASEGSLKDGIHMGAPPSFGAASASTYRGVLQSNSYPCLIGDPSMSWNLGNVFESSQSSEPAFTIEGGMVLPYQNRQAYCSALNNNTSYIMPQPLNRAHSQHDMLLSAPPHAKAMQLSMNHLDSKMPTAHRISNNLLSHEQTQEEEANILCAVNHATTNSLSSNRSLVHQRSMSDMSKNVQSFSQALPFQSQQNVGGDMGNGFQFFTYPSSHEGARSSLDFNSSSTNQLDGLLWMHGNTKTVRTLNVPSATNDAYDHDLENSQPKLMDGEGLTGSSCEQPKTMRWELALSSPDNTEEESKMRELTPAVGGASTQLEMNDTIVALDTKGKESINE